MATVTSTNVYTVIVQSRNKLLVAIKKWLIFDGKYYKNVNSLDRKTEEQKSQEIN